MCFHLQAAGKEVGNPEAAKPKAIEFLFQLLLFGFAALVGRIYLQPHYVGSICSKMYPTDSLQKELQDLSGCDS